MSAVRRALPVVLAAWLVAAAALAGSAQEAPPTTTGPDGEPATLGPSELSTPEDHTVAPDIAAPAYILMTKEGQVLAERASTEPRPVASLTKLMTAWLVQQAGGWNDTVTVSSAAADRPGSTAELEAGDASFSVALMLQLMLVTSANDAAYALAEHLEGSVDAFVTAMNEEAARLGLDDSVFTSPDGFDDDGTSTARDIADLYRRIVLESEVPGGGGNRVLLAAGRKRVAVTGSDGSQDTFLNRNVLLWLDPRVRSGKTGFTTGASFCLAVHAVGDDGRVLFAVVLGDADEPFSDAEALLNHGFDGFEQQTLVEAGEEVDRIGDLRVVAGRSLVRLLPVGTEADPEKIVNLLDDSSDAVAGDKVGTLVVKIAGKVVGKVPLRAADPEASPTGDAGDDDGGGALDTFPLVAAGGMLGGLLVLMILVKVLRSRRRAW